MKFAAMRELNIGLLLFASVITLAMLAGTVPKREGRHQMRSFVRMLAAMLAAMLCETVFLVTDGNPRYSIALYVSAVSAMICGMLVCMLFLHCLVSFVKEQSRGLQTLVKALNWIYGALCTAIVLTVPAGWFFFVDREGFYHNGPLYGLVEGVLFATNLIVLGLIVRFRKYLPLRGKLNLLAFSLIIAAASALVPFWYPTPEYLVATVSSVLLYNFFQEELLWQLTESKISITLSQMQPHFMYNVLNSIYYLCQRDPRQAQDAVDKFSDYLRNNMNSLEQTALIPFEQEYQHIQTYLSLEQIRFRNLKVSYDIQTTDFRLPPLTVQPLVENAVKHGITKKRGGGTVTISTREGEKQFCISVQDTGVGFDPAGYDNDGKLHIGINNVRVRLMHMIGGTLEITSKLGEGTTAVVKIPKKEAN